MRDALASALEGEPDLVVAGLASNGQQALHSYLALQPDVVIMDLMMPVRDGVSATADILAHDAAARILVLTSAVGDERVVQALAAGAQGYLLKDAERDQILEGVRRVARGELFLPPESAGKLVRALQQGGTRWPPYLHRSCRRASWTYCRWRPAAFLTPRSQAGLFSARAPYGCIFITSSRNSA